MDDLLVTGGHKIYKGVVYTLERSLHRVSALQTLPDTFIEESLDGYLSPKLAVCFRLTLIFHP